MSAFLSLICSLIFFNAFFVSVAEAALKNITIPLPEGTSDHGDPGLICTPTKWTDLFTFFLGNFATHVATIKFLPGERNIDMLPTLALSLLFPAFGVFRGIMNILTAPISAKKQGPHQMAVRARALCMVVRGPNWKPIPGDEVQDVILQYRIEGKIPEKGIKLVINHVFKTPLNGSELMGTMNRPNPRRNRSFRVCDAMVLGKLSRQPPGVLSDRTWESSSARRISAGYCSVGCRGPQL